MEVLGQFFQGLLETDGYGHGSWGWSFELQTLPSFGLYCCRVCIGQYLMSARDVVMIASVLCVSGASTFCRLIIYILLFSQETPVAGIYFKPRGVSQMLWE